MDWLKMVGNYKIKHYRNGELIDEQTKGNLVTTAAKNYTLGVMLGGALFTKIPEWYIGLVGAVSSISASDTLVYHANWTELTPGTHYTGNRKLWTPNDPASQSISNTTPIVFEMDATIQVNGFFLCSAETGSTSGDLLWSVATVNTAINAVSGDEINVSYEMSIN